MQTHCQSYVQPTGCTKSVSENSVYIHGHRVIGNDTVATAGVFNQLSHNRQPVSTLNIFCLCLWRAVFRQLLFDRRILLFAVDNSLCISGLKIIMETDLAQLRVYNWSRKAPSYVSLVSSSLSCMGSILIVLAYCLLKEMRSGAQAIITLLAIADFFTGFGYIMGSVNFLVNFKDQKDNDCPAFTSICEIQSFITTWSTMSSYC